MPQKSESMCDIQVTQMTLYKTSERTYVVVFGPHQNDHSKQTSYTNLLKKLNIDHHHFSNCDFVYHETVCLAHVIFQNR